MKKTTPTLVFTDTRASSPFAGYAAQRREEHRQRVAEARRRGQEALREELEARRRFGISWSPF